MLNQFRLRQAALVVKLAEAKPKLSEMNSVDAVLLLEELKGEVDALAALHSLLQLKQPHLQCDVLPTVTVPAAEPSTSVELLATRCLYDLLSNEFAASTSA
eukprot:NODE_9974_length_499_cov_34.440860_g9951_i0.p2 GENE.NODE_9974_length_499_cov_34.440860_g9951_i0~~NODE_9974_length_499_cov_34.440860_g9951_i0.p2  ORF type:complete len:101 (+),score=25.28 NODE_9974_length_499_cov_34.440860_g9951_i0:168-470(+)